MGDRRPRPHRSMAVEPSGRKYFLLGRALAHSLSPAIYRALGLDYSLKELPDEDAVAEFLGEREFSGLNVTIPYKQTVMRHLDCLNRTALDVGAVNLVLNDGGRLIGFNTDIGGLAKALSMAGITLNGHSIMILGNGGTAKTALHLALSSNPARVATVSRHGHLNYENCRSFDPDIIINTTPVGMYPNTEDKPLELKDYRNAHAVFDAVYNPIKTRLVQDAKALGLKHSGGLAMLAEQARLSYELFTGFKADEHLSSEIYYNCLRRISNIVLVGMAGAGKTSIGRRLSEIEGRPFLDTDELIETKAGMRIPEFFRSFGEAAFRKLESEVVREATLRNGAIIATGGGALLDEENRYLLGANAIGVHIKRDLRLLDVSGRPMYQAHKVEELWEKRRLVYDRFCDFEVDNSGGIDDAVNEILNGVRKLGHLRPGGHS